MRKLRRALNAARPGGGTPTAAALDAALSYFTTGDGKDLQGDRFVLLATDGGPNCGANDATCAADHCTPNLDGACPAEQGNCCEGDGLYCLDDAAVVEKLKALAEASVPTFVIGIPGTERYAGYLNGFATAGGVPNPGAPPDYYAVSAEGGVAALTQTFIDITTHLVRSCEVDLGPLVPDKNLVNVAVDCDVVPFEDGAGWDIDGDAPTTLRRYQEGLPHRRGRRDRQLRGRAQQHHQSGPGVRVPAPATSRRHEARYDEGPGPLHPRFG